MFIIIKCTVIGLNFIFLVTPASMWTKKEVAEFKDSIRNEGGDSIIKVIRSNFAEAAFLQ